ncbi:MAG: M28 family peptidase [Bryobacterales bacterium]
MRCAQTLALTLALAACSGRSAPAGLATLGERALDYTRQAVEMGPRPAGSEENGKQREWIVKTLEATGCKPVEDSFTAYTPLGPRKMANVWCDFPGDSGRLIVISGHYDTMSREGLHFVGANDGGSSTGALLALADHLAKQTRKDTVRVVFFDGEESAVAWEGDDHTYGSRRLAEQWAADGTLAKVKALINIDMIGDADLAVLAEGNSTPWLRELIVDVAAGLGYSRQFPAGPLQYVEDDHIPFLRAGAPAVDLIDFNYGLYNRYWHTNADTMDKLSAESFAAVLTVLDGAIRELEKRP